MGFLFHMIEIPKALTLTFLSGFWSSLKFVVMASLTGLGLYKPPPEEDGDHSGYHPNSYILLLDGTSPSLVPIPIHVATAAVKRKVPVVLFRDYLRGRPERDDEREHGWCCSICLEEIELDQEVRDPLTCDHVFHRPCLDTWVDEGQITCPICRSMLLPRKLSSFRIELAPEERCQLPEYSSVPS